jgi:signal transduction histidine kinase
MLERVRQSFDDPRVKHATDGLLATVLLAGSLAEIASGAAEWSGPAAVEVALAGACTLPLLWRRDHPVAVAAAITAGLLVAGAIVAPVQGPFEPFVAFEVAVYSIGVHAGRREGLATLAAVFTATLAAWALTAIRVDGTSYGDWIPALAWAAGAWAVGRAIHHRDLRTRELERLARELEAQRDARAREAVTVERARIARELHDVVAHNVSVMSVQAAAASRIMRADEPDVKRALETVERMGRETIDEMRRMLAVLRRSGDELSLSPQPSLRDLDCLVDHVRAGGLDVELTIEGTPQPLPAALDLSAYRIVQEALTNALKHAAPAHVDVRIRYTTDALALEVVDNGSRPVGQGTGNGLVGMRERVALFGGEIRAGRRAEGGWALSATLPLGAV